MRFLDGRAEILDGPASPRAGSIVVGAGAWKAPIGGGGIIGGSGSGSIPGGVYPVGGNVEKKPGNQ